MELKTTATGQIDFLMDLFDSAFALYMQSNFESHNVRSIWRFRDFCDGKVRRTSLNFLMDGLLPRFINKIRVLVQRRTRVVTKGNGANKKIIAGALSAVVA